MTIGDLNYGYDAGGKRNAVWGTYARTGLPTAITSATTYNAANQLTKWANKATANDLNGSLTNDSLGTTYTWNNRGQIALHCENRDGGQPSLVRSELSAPLQGSTSPSPAR